MCTAASTHTQQDFSDVPPHGPGCQAEPLGDLAIRGAFRNQRQDLLLTAREASPSVRRSAPFLFRFHSMSLFQAHDPGPRCSARGLTRRSLVALRSLDLRPTCGTERAAVRICCCLFTLCQKETDKTGHNNNRSVEVSSLSYGTEAAFRPSRGTENGACTTRRRLAQQTRPNAGQGQELYQLAGPPVPRAGGRVGRSPFSASADYTLATKVISTSPRACLCTVRLTTGSRRFCSQSTA